MRQSLSLLRLRLNQCLTMRLRALECRPSVATYRSNHELVPAMTRIMHGALAASLGLVALTFAANDGFARSGGARGGGSASTHSFSRPPGAHSFRHHGRNNLGVVWPGVGSFDYYGPPNGEAPVDVAPPASNDIRYTYTYDVPWDWAHRYPPAVVPSDRPYVSSCPTEAVTVPGRGGSQQTVNVMRCY